MKTAFGASAYVSYARADEKQRQVVSCLREDFNKDWAYLKVDENEVRLRESFIDFINEIGSADCVVVVFSENYLQSFYCMLELTRVIQHGDVIKRVFPVFVDDGFRLDGARQRWKRYWRDKFENWHLQNCMEPEEIDDAYGSIDECAEIFAGIDKLFDTFARRLAGRVPECNQATVEWVKRGVIKSVASFDRLCEFFSFMSESSL